MRGLAYRRQKLATVKAKVMKRGGSHIQVASPCACSCHMCGNPRRSAYNKGKEALTLPERKAEDSTAEQIQLWMCYWTDWDLEDPYYSADPESECSEEEILSWYYWNH